MSVNNRTSIQHSEWPTSSTPATTFLLLFFCTHPPCKSPHSFSPFRTVFCHAAGKVPQFIICCGLGCTRKTSSSSFAGWNVCALLSTSGARTMPPSCWRCSASVGRKEFKQLITATGSLQILFQLQGSFLSSTLQLHPSWTQEQHLGTHYLHSAAGWLAAFLSTAFRFLSILVWSSFSFSSV